VIIRSLAQHSQRIFLTFDDGPDPDATPEVLKVLREHGVPATFYLVAERAARHKGLLSEIQQAGHSIGNHSFDHRYHHYFKSAAHLAGWIKKAEAEFRRLGVKDLAGFRPPAGVLTPALVSAASELNMPLVLWNERFYDTVIPWSFTRANRSVERIRGGSIVLLHDRQNQKRAGQFGAILSSYITRLKARGFDFGKLPESSQLRDMAL
jgi:peptidoglycan/xylan/chitin deacetylase (PgdA/CDA1 family)